MSPDQSETLVGGSELDHSECSDQRRCLFECPHAGVEKESFWGNNEYLPKIIALLSNANGCVDLFESLRFV